MSESILEKLSKEAKKTPSNSSIFPDWNEQEISNILLDYQEEALKDEMAAGEVELKYTLKLIEYFQSKLEQQYEEKKVKIRIIHDNFIGFSSYETEVTEEYFASIADRLKGHGKIQIGGYIGDKTAIRRVYVVEEGTE
ncbi:hypothetical protein [Enterococcus sp. BWR-S5]|uniref:hypothetical protein n=1 Tax=Enterococcus sp. BWR-S5 TaxID=2787714 RepID=UPI0019239503|nr:hypothetical protein [Enterococcus sp. BWR-S5]MBL1223714.1 hypothetical protein [Enterococcus sp. BWR-S5]